MPPIPSIVWVVLALAVILVLTRIWARRLEQQGRRIDEQERPPRSLEGRRSHKSIPSPPDDPAAKPKNDRDE